MIVSQSTILRSINSPFTVHFIGKQTTISQAEVYEKLNQIYLLESRGNTLGESTPPNHRRQQLNGLLRSTPELDHQVTSSRHSILESVTSFHDGLIKQKNSQQMHSAFVFPCTTRRPVLFQCTHINSFAQVLCHPNQISNQIPKSL